MNERGSIALTDLLERTSKRVFFSKYWQRMPLYIATHESDRFAELLSIADIDTVISTTSLHAPQSSVRIVRSTEAEFFHELPPKARNGTIDIAMLYQSYSDGYTIVVRRLEKRWLPLVKLAAELRETFGAVVTIGAYLTPQNAQGLAPHFDGEDIIILQLEGKKTWQLYQMEVDISNSPTLSPDNIHFKTVTLNAGDLLYIPRYLGHQAAATEGSSSLHLTIAIELIQASNVLTEAINELAMHDPLLRKEVNYSGRTTAATKVLNSAKMGLSSLDLRQAAIKATERAQERVDPIPDGHFASLDKLRTITDASIVRVRSAITSVLTSETHSVVFFDGGKVAIPTVCRPGLDKFVRGMKFRVSDLPGLLSCEARLVFVRRLVMAGLLAIAEE